MIAREDARHRPRGPELATAVFVREAERLVSELPLIGAGVMALEITELRPFGAIEMLFAHVRHD